MTSERWNAAFMNFCQEAVGEAVEFCGEDPSVRRVVVYTSMQNALISTATAFQVGDTYVRSDFLQETLGQPIATDVLHQMQDSTSDSAFAAYKAFKGEGDVPSRFVIFYDTASGHMTSDFTYEDIEMGRPEADRGTLTKEWLERLQTTGEESAAPFVP